MVFKFMNWSRGTKGSRVAKNWAQLAESLQRGGKLPSRSERDAALKLYRNLGSILQLSDPRSIKSQTNLESAVLHPGTDWRWRPGLFCRPIVPSGLVAPESGQKLGEEIAIWHDCANKAFVIRQYQNKLPNITVPYGLRIDTLSFSGEYLSLSLDLPDTIQEWLGTSHILRVDFQLQAENWVEIYGRLNMKQGPNTEQVLRKISDIPIERSEPRTVEFDLTYADLSERPIEKIWLDLIFTSPYMSAIDLSDMKLSRYPRAEV